MSGSIPHQGFHIEEQANGFSQAQQEAAAQRWLESVDNTNLNEVVIEEIDVAITEFVTTKHTDEGGVERVRRKPYVRHTSVAAYVPNKIFHTVMKQFGRMQPLFASKNPEEQAEALDWMTDCVLNIWQLSEEDMTKKRLTEGLSMQQIQKLFKHFFAQLTLSVQGQAK